MINKTKHTLLDLLVIVLFLILSKYIEMEAFSFCMGAIYVMMFDIIDMWFRK